MGFAEELNPSYAFCARCASCSASCADAYYALRPLFGH